MTKAITKTDQVKHHIINSINLKENLPPHIRADKFVSVVMVAVNKNPSLLEANRKSLYAACIQAAQDGLMPDGREAALVPYKGAVQYQPMVTGILKKVRNSGELASLSPHVVHAGDKFKYWIDEDGEHLNHVPNLLGDRGKEIQVYCLAKTKDGATYIEVMSHAEVEKVRLNSPSKNSPAWRDWWGEMAKKTVIKRLSKRLPMSTDVENSLAINDAIDITPVEPEEKPVRKSRMKAIVETSAQVIENISPVEEAIAKETIDGVPFDDVINNADIVSTEAGPGPEETL